MLGATTDGDVVILELQREERRNALNLELCREIHAAVDQAVDDGARVIVITGQGSAFCAGADLGGVYGDEFLEALYGMLPRLTKVPVPLIAAVNGPAIGAGTQLAMACDLRVADATAKFAVPTARNGMAVDAWTIRTLAAMAGGGHGAAPDARRRDARPRGRPCRGSRRPRRHARRCGRLGARDRRVRPTHTGAQQAHPQRHRRPTMRRSTRASRRSGPARTYESRLRRATRSDRRSSRAADDAAWCFARSTSTWSVASLTTSRSRTSAGRCRTPSSPTSRPVSPARSATSGSGRGTDVRSTSPRPRAGRSRCSRARVSVPCRDAVAVTVRGTAVLHTPDTEVAWDLLMRAGRSEPAPAPDRTPRAMKR